MPIDIAFLKELDRFRMVLKKRVISKYQGNEDSTLPGEGLVFKDFTQYTPGDDFRRVDWNVYARTERLFVRRFEEERNMIMHIILDASASMKFGRKMNKFDYASMVGIGFAYITMRDNGKFNFATFSDKLNVLRVERERSMVTILDHLKKLKVGGRTSIRNSLESYKRNIHSKSMIVIISDFLYDVDDIKEILLRYKRNYVYLIQVLDPAEIDLAMRGDVIFQDMEYKTSLRTFVTNRFKNKYAERLREHNMAIKDLCERFKASFITVTTSDTIFDTFYRILFNPA